MKFLTTTKKTPLAIETRDLSKTFDTVVANYKVCLEAARGEILAVLGENGSGKTTLMNMLSGIYFPDEGEIFINGQEVTIRSPIDAFRLGIGMVHQHFKLVDVLTATDNIVLGLTNKAFLDRSQLSAKISEISSRYGFKLDPEQKIYNMSVSEKQTVEIVKVLYRGADILILDEPTAVLTPQETDKLFDILHRMKEDNKSIIIITHKLNEVMAVSDRVHILRKGRSIATVDTAATTTQKLTEMMVGRAISLKIDRPITVNKQPKLEVKNLTCKNHEGRTVLDDLCFSVNSGEILGVAGVAGSGQKELCEALAGLFAIHSGEILFHDKDKISSIVGLPPMEIIKMGISLSFVPEDRLGMGLVAAMDMTDNVMLRHYYKGSGPFTDRKSSYSLAQQLIKQLEINTPGVDIPVRLLSGGNVQKVLLGREIASSPQVLIVAYPVRGLDINSSYTIYRMLNEEKQRGVAVLFIGEDLDVLLELTDRILVLCGGRVSGIVDAQKTTKEQVGLLMTQTSEVKKVKSHAK
ncbi:MAG: ABC transporter ATP-binding protein [Firmicutes bacterium]|nr:ABC transporter ATP-binding protein [Bacillota bacterium]